MQMTSLYILELLRVHATFNLPKGRNKKRENKGAAGEVGRGIWRQTSEAVGKTNVCFGIRCTGFIFKWHTDR